MALPYDILFKCGAELVIFGLLCFAEFVGTVFTNSLLIRLYLCLSISLMLYRLQFLFQTKIEKKIVIPIWTTACFISLWGLCIVTAINVLQQLMYRHDSGMHWPLYLIIVGIFDVIWKLLRSGAVADQLGVSKPIRIWLYVFMGAAGVETIIVGILRVALSPENSGFIEKFDPSLAGLSCLGVFSMTYMPARRFMKMVLLAVPEDFDDSKLKKDFDSAFPRHRSHHWHVWECAPGNRSVTLHVKPVGEPQTLVHEEVNVAPMRRFLQHRGFSYVSVHLDFASENAATQICNVPEVCAQYRCCDQ